MPDSYKDPPSHMRSTRPVQSSKVIVSHRDNGAQVLLDKLGVLLKPG